jgi:hypothetical protein
MFWSRGFGGEHRVIDLMAGGLLVVLLGAAVPADAQSSSDQKPPAKKAAPTVVTPNGKPVPPAVQKLLKKGAKPEAEQELNNDEVPIQTPPAGTQVPPGGRWLKDKEGHEYYLEKLDKSGKFLRLSDKKIRTVWGIDVEVAKEDDKFFYYKVYKEQLGSGPSGVTPHPTADDQERIAASYHTDTQESSRLNFLAFDDGLPKQGQWRNGFDLGDMNGDGATDIVSAPARKSFSNPTIFLGDNKGHWKRWTGTSYPRLPFDYGDAAVADLNGDGHLDVALAMHLRGVVALLGDGKGTFTDWSKGLDLRVPGSKSGEEQGFSTRALAIADWNQDGKPDIIALGEGPRMNVGARGKTVGTGSSESFGTVVYLNQGNGTWVRKDQGTSSREVFGDTIVAVDLNGDGRPDFVTSSSVQGALSLVNLNRGDGSWDGYDVEALRPGAYVWAIAAGDFDKDGKKDLAIGYIAYEGEAWRTGLDVLLAQAGGGWKRKTLAAKEGREGVTALGAGDLDGDGNADLVALTGDGQTWVFLGDGKGGFTREATNIPPYPGGCRGYHVQAIDLDGDGKAEFIAEFAGENSPQFAPDLCPSGGGITAWKPVLKSANP